MRAERIDHIHYSVKNVEKVVPALESLLSSECWTFQGGKKILDLTAEHGIKLGHHRLGIEIAQVTDQKKRPGQMPTGSEDGVFVIDFKVPDVEKAVAELRPRGFKVVMPLVQTGQVKEVLLECPDIPGIQIELCEYPGDDITVAAGVVAE